MNLATVKKITLLFLAWRVGLFLVAFLADSILLYAPSFPYADSLLPSFGLPRFIYSFANFDGVHYLTIAKEGYLQTNYIQAFFPFYPVSIQFLNDLLPFFNDMVLGFFISHICFLGFLLFGFDIVKKWWNVSVAWKFIAVVLLFPWSFFFVSYYTESLFLFLLLLSFWFAQKKNWVAAGFVAALLSSTRIVGIFIVPALLLELYAQTKQVLPTRFGIPTLKFFFFKEWKNVCCILLGSLGLLAYMLFLNRHFNDPLYFLNVQSAFGAGRSTSIVLYPQVVWRALKILLTSPLDIRYITYLQEFLAGTLGLVALLFSVKRVRFSIVLFSFVVFFIPPLSGSFLSMGRFLLPCLAIYFWIASSFNQRPSVWYGWLLISTLLLVLNTLLFIQGYWVA